MAEPLPLSTKLADTYEIIRVLSKSEPLNVYLAQDSTMFRNWIVREFILPEEDDETVKQIVDHFMKEAEYLASIDHPSFARIQEVYIIENRCYMISESIDGRTFEDFIQTSLEPVTDKQVKIWLGQVCELLKDLHEKKPPVALGTLKPGSIMITPLGKAKIWDFGDERVFPILLQYEEFQKNTYFYAPELLRDEEVTPKSDIYSLGAIAYYALTGEMPHLEITERKLIEHLRSDIDEDLIDIITIALQPLPEDRFENITEMQEALMGKAVFYERPKVGVSTKLIDLGTVQKGASLTAAFKVTNLGGGILSCTIKPEAHWVRTSPDLFTANDEEINLWVDTSQMDYDKEYKTYLTVLGRGNYETVVIKVRTLPSLTKRMPDLAAMFYLLIPLLVFSVFTFGILTYGGKRTHAFYNKTKGTVQANVKLSVSEKSKALRQINIPTYVVSNAKIAAFFLLLMPLVVPLLTQGIYNNLAKNQSSRLRIIYIMFLFAPIALLAAGLAINLNFMPDELIGLDSLRYLTLKHIAVPFIIINIIAGIYLAIPREKRMPEFMKKTPELWMVTLAVAYMAYGYVIFKYVLI
ncbi:MAG: protein kinase [Chloroflexi bacterium]|nr:protein kinase [Chloroflexota bacterium]